MKNAFLADQTSKICVCVHSVPCVFSLTIHYFALAGCYFRAAFKSHSLFSKGFDSGTGWDDCSKNGTKSVSSNNFVAG